MSSGKIAQNTLALFTRQVVMALISLYTVRVVISELGINDFGLMNVLTNVVGLSTFIVGALGMITQRYISFAIGSGKDGERKRYHDACLVLHVLCAIITVIALQTAGVWFVSNQLVVPPERLDAAQILFQFLMLSFIANLFFGFHSWLLISHEDIHVFAIFAVLGAALRLTAAVLIDVVGGDALVAYGVLLATASLLVMSAQALYCIRKYHECRLRHVQIDLVTIREMLGFVGWTLFGQFTTVCRAQALTILINQAYNPATVAARALSFTIYTQVVTFSQNFSSALNPPIVKTYAAGETEQTYKLIFFGSKIAFFLSWMVTLPMISLAPNILTLWVGTYPEETVLFARLALVEAAIISISFPLMAAVRAVGKVRTYELLLGGLQLMVLLLSWLLTRNGFPAYAIYLVAIAINLVMFVARLGLTSKLTGLSWARYLLVVALPVTLVVVVSSGLCWGLLQVVSDSGTLRLSLPSLFASLGILLIPALAVLALGLSRDERRSLHGMIRKRLGRSGARS